MVAANTPSKPAGAFPKAEVEASLRQELIAAAKVEAELRGAPWPADAAAQGAASLRVDSLVVAGTLCAVEPVLGFELSGSVVRAGGYESVDQAVGRLIPGLEGEWRKRKGGGS